MSSFSSKPQLRFSFDARVAEVMATLGYLPDATLGVLQIRFFDLMDNHRKKVAKNAGATWPAGARARRFVFAYSNRYGSTKRDPESFRDLLGESFMFAPRSIENQARFWQLFEEGGTVSGDAAMTIPFAQGTGPLGRDRILEGVVARTFERVGFGAEAARLKASAALGHEAYLDVGASGGLFDPDAARGSPAVGVLRRSLTRKPILKFAASFDAIKDRHFAKMDKVFDDALKATGRQAQAEAVAEAQALRAGRNQFSRDGRAGRSEFDRNLRRYLLNLRRAGVAKEIRDEARRRVEADRLKDQTRAA